MPNLNLLSPWIRRFLLEYLVGERNLARNTQQSYRDTLCQLLPFVANTVGKRLDRLLVEDLSAHMVLAFLQNLEEQRECSASTRNQRLASIHSLANFIGRRSPEHLVWSGDIREIAAKKAPHSLVTYLEKDEMDALLAAPDRSTRQGNRDYTILLFLYNTGARADEAVSVRGTDLELGTSEKRDRSSVLIRGKGQKLRRCPLWSSTADELRKALDGRSMSEKVFLNCRGQTFTRFGMHTLVERNVRKAAVSVPTIAKKRVSPHVIRHTTATHLLRAGVDINTIRAWLGHVSIETTNVYAEVDLEMKAKAIANCEVTETDAGKPWRQNQEIMTFLRSL
jgi:site-specific recombinase XerD